VEVSSGRSGRRAPVWVLSILFLGGAAYLGLFVSALTSSDNDLLHALTVVPILSVIALPIVFRIARSDADRTLAATLMAALAAKLLMSYVRYQVAYNLDNGRTDATQFDEAGQLLAPAFRKLNFEVDIGKFIGTGFIKYLTGLVYAIFGSGRITGFMVFAWISFLGFLLLTRAFRLGVPQGDSRRYTIAVMFLPSLLFWPAIISKEAWMMLGIGLASYGVAGIFRARTSAALPFAAGLGAMLLVRPHVALIVFIAMSFAMLVRKAPARTYAAPMVRVLVLGLVVVLGLFLVSRTATFFGEDTLTAESIDRTLTATSEQTTEAGSRFSPVRVDTPFDMIPAIVTVVFRPFPNEVTSLTGLATAAEGVFLIALFVAARKRLRSVPRMLRTTPYVAYCLAYALAFVFAFSSFSNFGILARQRVQMMPFLLVLIALPTFRELTGPVDAGSPEEPTPVAVGTPAIPAASSERRRPTHSGTRRRLRPPRPQSVARTVSSSTHFRPPPRPVR
jgi:hypothetical protein